ncbi:MAG TPA: MSMEG_4193 family putative phosphomutase [Patescibacteria group bacterium]|nr:MSMEG_4193 family putative phosphomutase [Patescibacteria group bacterium]
MTVILLIRHGQNDWVDKKRLAGWTPGVHLNEEGQKQVASLAGRLEKLPIKAFYSSPLARCVETAQAIAQPREMDVQIRESVGEVRYGRWEGKKIKKLAKKKRKWHAVQHYPSRFRFPGGESFLEVQSRAVSTLETLNNHHAEEIIAVVSHADVIKLLLAYYIGSHIDLFQRIIVSPASVSVLALGQDGSGRVLRINDAGPIRLPENPKAVNHEGKGH